MFFGALLSMMWLFGAPPRGEEWQYTLRWIGVAMLVVPIPILVWAQFRKDRIPDLLSRTLPRFFERDGFCFAVVPEAVDGSCRLAIYFQNRYERPCQAVIVLKGSQFLFRRQADVGSVNLGIACPAAAFGKSSIQWIIPAEAQGRQISLDVVASVKYPDGRGKLLRYKDGLRVGAAGTDVWREGLQIMGAMGGAIVFHKPARISFTLPTGVATNSDVPPDCRTEILWKLDASAS